MKTYHRTRKTNNNRVNTHQRVYFFFLLRHQTRYRRRLTRLLSLANTVFSLHKWYTFNTEGISCTIRRWHTTVHERQEHQKSPPPTPAANGPPGLPLVRQMAFPHQSTQNSCNNFWSTRHLNRRFNKRQFSTSTEHPMPNTLESLLT